MVGQLCGRGVRRGPWRLPGSGVRRLRPAASGQGDVHARLPGGRDCRVPLAGPSADRQGHGRGAGGREQDKGPVRILTKGRSVAHHSSRRVFPRLNHHRLEAGHLIAHHQQCAGRPVV